MQVFFLFFYSKKITHRFFQFAEHGSLLQTNYCLPQFQKNQNGTAYGNAYISTSGKYWARGHSDFEHRKALISDFNFFETGFTSFCSVELNNQSSPSELNPSYVNGGIWHKELYKDTILWLSSSSISLVTGVSAGTKFCNALQCLESEFPNNWLVSIFVILCNWQSLPPVTWVKESAIFTIPGLDSSGCLCFLNGSRILMAGPVSKKIQVRFF